jgi:hypothetical protein
MNILSSPTNSKLTFHFTTLNQSVRQSPSQSRPSQKGKLAPLFGHTFQMFNSENEFFEIGHLTKSNEKPIIEIDNHSMDMSDIFMENDLEIDNKQTFVNSENIFKSVYFAKPSQGCEEVNFSFSRSKQQNVDSAKRSRRSSRTSANTSSNLSTLKKSCGCKSTKCLRLHCKCFKELGYCGPDCGCVGCFNQPEFEEARSFVIEKTQLINQNAFRSKAVQLNTDYADTKVNSHGCSCKTGCQNGYCDCSRLSAGCSPMCRCVNCKNTKVEIEREEVKKLYSMKKRRKDKIVISADISEINHGQRDFNDALSDMNEHTGKRNTIQKGLSIALHNSKKIKLETIKFNL